MKHQKFYEINEAYEIVIKTSKESSKEVRAGLNKKLGKTFGQGKVSSNQTIFKVRSFFSQVWSNQN